MTCGAFIKNDILNSLVWLTAPKKRLVPPAFLKKNTTGDCLDTFHGNFGTTKNKCCDELFFCALKVVLVLGGSRISPYTVHYKMEKRKK